nr:hypothetical protein [Tanacetum cinerariifolium]GEV99538.1 hypothetical protein [Tanacetum cinerariifolium]
MREMTILGWANFYGRIVNIVDEHQHHHLDEKKKNPNYNETYNIYGFAWAFKDSIPIVNLDPTPAEKIQAWFDSSIPYFNGIVDEDGKGCEDDYVLVSKDNSVVEDSNVCEVASAGLSKDEIVNDKLVDEDCNVCDDASAKAGCRNSEEDNKNQPANVLIRELYDVIKSICSRPDMHNGEASCDGMEIDKPDQMNDYNCSQPIPASVDVLIQACAYAADHPELDALQHEAHLLTIC